ncbi:MAG: histidine phosphatase family protein [Betaproteobacteria bacterium]|nr:histidine phosphatase family protein [Betaproteobacteria bacterium]
MSVILFALRIIALAGACFVAAANAQTVVLVRHAEKAESPKDDPPLAEAGQRRADALAVALKGANVAAILTSQARRTRDTAAPLATQARITPRVLTIARGGMAEHVAEVVKLARERKDGVVVIVGHSNTVPAIARALGADVADMSECEYSRFITVLSGPPAQAITTRYGAPDGGCL